MTSRNLFLLLTLLYIPISEINAAQTHYDDDLLEFNLTAGHLDTQFKFPLTTYKTSIDVVNINWYEAFSPYFHAGIEAGAFDMSQANNTITTAQFTQGQFAGLLLRFIPLESQYINLYLNYNYRYSQSKGGTPVQSSQFAWHQNLASAELQFKISRLMQIFAAADYYQLSGEQRDSGTINQITSFTQQNNTGYRLGLDFRSNRHYIIRLSSLSGYQDGTKIEFIHRFQ